MKEDSALDQIANVVEENSRRIRAAGREIDEIFISRGFLSVRAEIELMQKLYGVGSYDLYLDAHSSHESFERYRQHANQVREKMTIAKSQSESSLAAMWNDVKSDPKLSGVSKNGFLRIISKSRFDELNLPHSLDVRNAYQEEQRGLCKLTSDSTTQLHNSQFAELRKSVCNAVMADSFARLGFVELRKSKGVSLYCKKVTSRCSMIVEPDVVLMERNYPASHASDTVYWPQVPFDMIKYLGGGSQKDRSRSFLFAAPANCIAINKMTAYDDTRSLEVAIRANALWYEICIAPIERLLSDL